VVDLLSSLPNNLSSRLYFIVKKEVANTEDVEGILV
jgi:hypothetical protein